MNTDKDQLNKAEVALWQIFNLVSNLSLSRKNKKLFDIRQIVKNYLDDKINKKEEEREEK